MADNNVRWHGNLLVPGALPWRVKAKFQAGATQAIKRGEILEFTGDTNSAFVPIDSDYNMATTGDLAIADEEIKAGDAAGYYWVILPRLGDVFEFELAAAGAHAAGTALYYSSSEKLTVTAGTNIIAYTCDFRPVPKQGHASLAQPDQGTTLQSGSRYYVTFRTSVSYGARILKS